MRVQAVSPETQAAILAWYDARGRALPFRGQRDPYAILVSEVMAQQTQISRVAEQWATFMTSVPDGREPCRCPDRRRPSSLARSRIQPPRAQPPAGGARHRLGARRNGSIQPRRAARASGRRALHGPCRCRPGIRAGGRAGRYQCAPRPRPPRERRWRHERPRAPVDRRQVRASRSAGGLDACVDGPWRDGLPPHRAALCRVSRRAVVSVGDAGDASSAARRAGCRRHVRVDEPVAARTDRRSAARRVRRRVGSGHRTDRRARGGGRRTRLSWQWSPRASSSGIWPTPVESDWRGERRQAVRSRNVTQQKPG